MRKVTKRLNYDRLSKTKSVWNITSWVFLFIKENSYKTNAFTCFQFFFIKKFATLCNEKIMPNLKGLNNQNKAFIYLINKEYINIVWSSPIRYHRFAKCTKSFSFLNWACAEIVLEYIADRKRSCKFNLHEINLRFIWFS